MEEQLDLGKINWGEVVDRLVSHGWVRLRSAIDGPILQALERAAPETWSSLPETEGSAGVRQAGLSSHGAVDQSADAVRSLADEIKAGIDGVGRGLDPLPAFNHAEWCRAEKAQKFITAHRDPDTAGGVIAVVTLRGAATFRIWDLQGSLTDAQHHPELATSWPTEDGDLVIMRGGGWPSASSRCPIHEAESPPDGDRVTLTLRHNKGGYGADYFA